jgi:CBS-domain-containing membrane protein
MFVRAGATGLNAAVQSNIVTMAWWYLPTVLASSLIMLGWAVIINNVGHRRYPVFWWKAGKVFVSATKEEKRKETQRELREIETGLRSAENEIFNHGIDEAQSSGNGGDPPENTV